MRKIAYLIPGYKESATKQKVYSRIARLFEEAGIEPIHIKIDWSARNFESYVRQFERQQKKYRRSKICTFGFSFGAMIALMEGSRKNIGPLILGSLSPYFKEDLETIPPGWLRFWKKNFRGGDISFVALAPKIRSRVYLVAGDQEGPEIMRRANIAKRLIRNSSLFIAKGSTHSLNQKKYLAAIKKVIARSASSNSPRGGRARRVPLSR